MMKFEKVKKALENKTYNTNDWLTVVKGGDCRHKYKYCIKNVVTKSLKAESYKTLNDIVKEFELEIN